MQRLVPLNTADSLDLIALRGGGHGWPVESFRRAGGGVDLQTPPNWSRHWGGTAWPGPSCRSSRVMRLSSSVAVRVPLSVEAGVNCRASAGEAEAIVRYVDRWRGFRGSVFMPCVRFRKVEPIVPLPRMPCG